LTQNVPAVRSKSGILGQTPRSLSRTRSLAVTHPLNDTPLRQGMATSTGDSPTWITAGVALAEVACHPWGSFGDLLHTGKNHPIVKTLFTDPYFQLDGIRYLMSGSRLFLAPCVPHRLSVWHNLRLSSSGSLKWLSKNNDQHVKSLAEQGYSHVHDFLFDWRVLSVTHLGVPENFYEHPGRCDAVSHLRQPAHVLPRYGDFVFRVALKALPVRSSLHFLGQDARHCLLCDAQMCETVVVRLCTMCALLRMRLPSTLAGFLYDGAAAPCSC
ncbi:hypothetical protein ACHHYP_20427, partial [Achlya hypogyna]